MVIPFYIESMNPKLFLSQFDDDIEHFSKEKLTILWCVSNKRKTVYIGPLCNLSRKLLYWNFIGIINDRT